jgi:signal transduction histidine kinase
MNTETQKESDMTNTRQNAGNGRLEMASLSSRGSRAQFVVAMALISIIPILTLVYAFWPHVDLTTISTSRIWTLGGIMGMTICLGYGLLLRYPRTMIRLRRQMEQIARGELPERIELIEGEGDITAIEEYFNLIVAGMKERISTITEQGEQLVVAERQRVMTESLCTACHCLGQPATAIGCYLQLLKSEALSPAGNHYLSSCLDEADRMRVTLLELQGITEYETVPYCKSSGAQSDTSPMIIVTQADKAAVQHKHDKVEIHLDALVMEPAFLACA